MKTIVALGLIAIALLLAHGFTFVPAFDCAITGSYADPPLYRQKGEAFALSELLAHTLKGNSKEIVVSALEKFKNENPDKVITFTVESNRILFNSSVYLFQGNKLVDVKTEIEV